MKFCFALLAVMGIAGAAQAQFATGFEPTTYTPGPLTNGFGGPPGQGNWYNPVSGSIDFSVHPSVGNALGFPANPNGGAQFIGVTGQAAPNNIGRAQHNMNFSGGGVWTVDWDVIGGFRGAQGGAAVDNLGSFSLQPSGSADYFQQIMQWGANTATPTQYNINYGVWGAGGGDSTTIAFSSPGAAWTNIPSDHWIHQSTTWDFGANKLLSLSIQDITAGGALTTVDVSGNGWYLTGGQNNALGLSLPTDIRCFTGNTNNATGWDNINVIPAPGTLALMGLGLVARRRRR